MISTAFRESLNRYASREVDLTPRKGGGFMITVRCLHCDLPHEAMAIGTLMAPQAIASKLRDRGWQIGHRTLCPTHKSMKRNTPMTTTQTPLHTSEKAREAKRLVMMSLDDYFDAAKGQYRDGKNDAAIGKDCGLAVSVVAKLRDEFYGPLRAPTEFENLLSEGHSRMKELEAARSNAQATMGKLESYAKAQGWA